MTNTNSVIKEPTVWEEPTKGRTDEDNRQVATEQLEAALKADSEPLKNYYVRSALQTLVIDIEGPPD